MLSGSLGVHTLNGNGEMTGMPWIEEMGTVNWPIAITNTHSVGVVRCNTTSRHTKIIIFSNEFENLF